MKEKRWFPVIHSAPRGAATKKESDCLPGLQANGTDFRWVDFGNGTEKPKRYQENNSIIAITVEAASVICIANIPCNFALRLKGLVVYPGREFVEIRPRIWPLPDWYLFGEGG
jgi:hypothetical protein